MCFVELRSEGASNILQNHIKSKHSVDKITPPKRRNEDSPFKLIMTPNELRALSRDSHSLDYNDLCLTSMKPLPSSSISKNFLSRLNQLSSPVTRKLKFWNKKSFQVNQYDPSFKVIYLGNLGMQLWSKDESCLDKPLGTLWNNYLVNMKTEIVMRLTICNSGLKAITRQHGLTQYWSNRLVYCCSHKNYPRIFSWVYRHEGKKMRQELRCHAVFCPTPEKATKMVTMLNQRLACALQEFKREKKSRGFTIVSNITSSQQQKMPRTIPLRRQILAKGSANFRPPLERSKSAPRLTSIVEEDYDTDEHEFQDEFEFEESFGDKDASDCEVYEDGIGSSKDGDSIHNIESNSPITNILEGTSNKSSYPEVDNYHDKQTTDSETNGNSDEFLVERNQANRLATSNLVRPSDEIPTLVECPPIKERSALSSNDKHIVSHNNLNIQISSANVNTSSSFKRREVAKRDTRRIHTPTIEKTTNNNSSEAEKPQLVDKVDDVILSWSNLVIK